MYCVCGSVALLIQHAKHTHCIAINCLSNFSTLPHKVKIFRLKLLNIKVCCFSKNFVQNISYSKKNREDTIINVLHLHVKCQWIVSDFNENLIFLIEIKKILKYQISWKYIQWEPSCSVWMAGRINIRFSQVCKRLKRDRLQ